MKKLCATVLAGLAAMSLGSAAKAATYDFNFDNGVAVGTFTTVAASGDAQLISALTGTYYGNAITDFLTVGQPFAGDNVLYPNMDSPNGGGYLDGGGFSFFFAGQPPANYEAINYGGGFYFGYPGDQEYTTFALSPVSAAPEPATWALMLAGLAMIGAALRFARRRPGPVVA